MECVCNIVNVCAQLICNLIDCQRTFQSSIKFGNTKRMYVCIYCQFIYQLLPHTKSLICKFTLHISFHIVAILWTAGASKAYVIRLYDASWLKLVLSRFCFALIRRFCNAKISSVKQTITERRKKKTNTNTNTMPFPYPLPITVLSIHTPHSTKWELDLELNLNLERAPRQGRDGHSK